MPVYYTQSQASDLAVLLSGDQIIEDNKTFQDDTYFGNGLSSLKADGTAELVGVSFTNGSIKVVDGTLQIYDYGYAAWVSIGCNNGILTVSDPIV